jgi:hypothetical protein
VLRAATVAPHRHSRYPDEAAYHSAQEREPFAAESLIPSGLFAGQGEVERAEAVFAGRVLRAEVRSNPASGTAFHVLLVRTLGGIFDVVADPTVVTGEPVVGGVVRCVAWLSGRVIGTEPRLWRSRGCPQGNRAHLTRRSTYDQAQHPRHGSAAEFARSDGRLRARSTAAKATSGSRAPRPAQPGYPASRGHQLYEAIVGTRARTLRLAERFGTVLTKRSDSASSFRDPRSTRSTRRPTCPRKPILTRHQSRRSVAMRRVPLGSTSAEPTRP